MASYRFIPPSAGNHLPPLTSIVRLEGSGNYTIIHLATGKPLYMAYTLAWYQMQLPGFIRIHKSHLVNPDYVTRVNDEARAEHSLILSGQRLPISRRRWAEVALALRAKPRYRFRKTEGETWTPSCASANNDLAHGA